MFDALAAELTDVFGRGVDAPLDGEAFDALALKVFRYQFRANPVYAGFSRRRGATPETVERWHRIPAVPTRAFKSLRPLSPPDAPVEALFRTSGTSRGPGSRGEHPVRSLALYHASLLPNFRAHLLPDDARLPLVSLIPSPERAPDSSLSHMVGVVRRELCSGGGWFVDPAGGLLESDLHDALSALEADGVPALIAGTAFAFVHWLDAMAREGWRVRLPDGTRVMETGGFKGRSREVEREELYAAIDERMGVPPERVVNEYGMTELLSQFYEPHLRDRPGPGAAGGETVGAEGAAGDAPAPSASGAAPEGLRRRHVAPPWLRTRVLDPATLEPLPPGTPGLLCHWDLANLGSVMAVLTEDVEVEVDDGIRVLGRAGDAEPRGCSLAMDELLSVAESGP